MGKKNAAASIAEGPAVLEWLLEDSDPEVKLYTLTRLLGKSESCLEAAAAREALMSSGPVADILGRLSEGGYWGAGPDFYRSKYKGGVWQLIVLAELGADSRDPRIRAACEYIFEHSQDRESGGFSVDPAAGGGGRHGTVLPCLTGNMVFSLESLGFGKDERTARAIEWICKYQRADDGESHAPDGWPYDSLSGCFGRHSCFMGVVKSLKGLAAIPPRSRDATMKAKITELSEFILTHRVHKRSHDLASVSRPGWLKLGFPLMYQTDILEILCILRDLGIEDDRMSDARQALLSKRGADGHWILENSFNGRTLVSIEEKGATSKWITARALYALGA